MKTLTKLTLMTALSTVAVAGGAHAQAVWYNPISWLPTPASFNEYLGDAYTALARMENLPGQEDIEDAVILEAQAKRAYDGATPFTLHPLHKVRYVQDTPERLMGIKNTLEAHLAQGTANTHPVPLAQAMANFDCWVEQQESEKNSRHNVNSCLPALEAALAQLPALQTAAAPVTATVQTQRAELNLLDTVYFDFDRSNVNDESKKKIDALESKVKRADRGAVVITGHADRSGPAEYNQGLSERRANAVAQYMNLPAGTFRVETEARGETDPAVQTADGVKLQANRRVTISIEAEKAKQVKTYQQQ